jgi:NADH-quinone oxidoreductase subunit N
VLQNTQNTAPALFALGLILVGLAFKVAAVPFQMWVPDVYQGAPTPISAYLSVGSKAAGFVVGYRLLQPFLDSQVLSGATQTALLGLAGATLLVGNLAAIPQGNFKRLIAYSSIAHAGFLLLALAVGPSKFSMSGIQVVSFYLGTYLLMTLLTFAVMIIVSRDSSSDDLSAYDGLGKRSPFLAMALLLAVISLAGVPLTAGFLGKFFVFNLAVSAGNLPIVILAIIGAAAGFYYYIKVVRSMYFNAPAADAAPLSIQPLTKAVMILLMLGTLLLGVWPGLLAGLIR